MKKILTFRDDSAAVVPTPNDVGITAPNDAVFDALSKAGNFLPRLQLIGANSNLGQDGSIAPGSYAIISAKDQYTDLGKSVDMFVLAWRPKALDMSDTDHIISSYNFDDDLFKQISAKADEKDSGCMFGVEFLVWIASVQKFATFYMGSKTGRVAAPKVRVYMGKGCTLKSTLITKGKYKWHGPTTQACMAPGVPPDPARAEEEIKRFMNPPATTVEAVDPTTAGTREV